MPCFSLRLSFYLFTNLNFNIFFRLSSIIMIFSVLLFLPSILILSKRFWRRRRKVLEPKTWPIFLIYFFTLLNSNLFLAEKLSFLILEFIQAFYLLILTSMQLLLISMGIFELVFISF